MKKSRPEGEPAQDVTRSLEAIRRDIDLILRRLDAIEDRLGESMTEEEMRDYDIAIEEHSRGETIPLEALQEFLTAVPDKSECPTAIDWDEEHYEEFD
jgi:hypothetical protein